MSKICLLIFQSEDDQDNFRFIQHELEEIFKDKVSFKGTCYERFIENKNEDSFDFSILVFMNEVSADDLEMQQEMIEHYAHVPVSQYVMTDEMQDKPKDQIQGVIDFITNNLKKAVIRPNPTFFEKSISKHAAE